MLELPTDRPRPPIQTFRGSTEYVKIRSDLTEQLRTLCQQSEATLFMALLAAFATLLSRYSGQEDILIGSPIANRNRREIEPLIGFFVNTLVLRVDLSENPTFQELLAQVRQVALDAYVHQDFPFEQLVEEIHPERHLNQNPLVQVMFAFQNIPIQPWNLPDLRLSPLEFDSGITRFDLEFYLWEVSDGLNGYFGYNIDLFDTTTITRMAEHFQTLLKGVVDNPQQRVSELPILTEGERHQILVEWNNTTTDYPKDKCLHELFEAQVERTPDAVALRFEDQQLTYRELNTRANQLAHHLQALGVGSEVLVGICVERSLEMVVGLLGVLKAGGAYVPLDPVYPLDRLAFMVEDTQMPVLLTQQQLLEKLPSSTAKVVCIDTGWKKVSRKSQKNPINEGNPKNLAYIIYTSGSTGKPKGVQISHRALVNFLYSMRHCPGFTDQDILLAVTTISFDIAGLELYLPLIVGGQIVLASQEEASDGKKLFEKLLSSNATIMQATPVSWRLLLSAGWKGEPPLKILCGGEALPRELANQLATRSSSVWNMYGPTETTIWSTLKKIESSEGMISIGRPIANTEIYILDSYLQPVPIGVAGELYIGGDGLSRGYFKRPDLTQEKFIPHPFSDKSGSRLYKTGDLACYLPDGNIEFFGRSDHQVKIRGFRIELGEIEAILAEHLAVREAVVIAREDQPGDSRLVAYVVEIEGEGQRVNAAELRKYLKEKLPEYMIPSAFVLLEVLPLTPNGKVDRRALPAPERSGLEKGYVAPRTPTEEVLTKIWTEVLGLKQIGIHDNFFELGGHSMIALRLMIKIQQQFERHLPLATLFQYPTIEQLANFLHQEPGSQPWSPLVPLQSEGSLPPLFCVHPGGGTVFCYTDLARHLGSNQPFYGLQAPGLEEGQEPYTQVEDMAMYYIRALQDVQPQGPYFLAGWSFGGVVAFEMAQQLCAQDQQVSLLAELDVDPPSSKIEEDTLKLDDAAFLAKVVGIDEIPGFDMHQLLEHLRRLSPDEQFIYIIKEASRAYLIPPDVGPATVRRFIHLARIQIQAAQNYIPQRYPGKITFFQASEREPDRDWGEFAVKGVETIIIPGNHHTVILEPHVRVLAEKLRACLERAPAGE